ncbi:MAG TPA: triose-phosphate isomerase [Deltaproteobacteria bacterium]|nr:triose-phosphate isomerase [Deltaproteobacteria bacterium]
MRKPLIAGNWKMFKSLDQVGTFADDFISRVLDIENTDILLCPPYVYVQSLAQACEGTQVMVGAQNVFWEDEGAYTGEISALMLKSIGAEYSIIGHSERRQFFHETDETVNKRLFASIKADLVPIVCVGETLNDRESGKTFDIIGSQIRQGLEGLGSDMADTLVIAYEPVWAIGTGKTATPQMAQEVHAYIRTVITGLFGKEIAQNMRILYGGSVKGDNIDSLMAQDDIDGALVGGASLDAASFERILRFKG